ncbi:MAG: hypothetical protein ACYDEF_17520 [Methanosarcina sp.]
MPTKFRDLEKSKGGLEKVFLEHYEASFSPHFQRLTTKNFWTGA